MTDSGSLQDSLAAMGFTELGLALLALCCYALAFNGALGLQISTRQRPSRSSPPARSPPSPIRGCTASS